MAARHSRQMVTVKNVMVNEMRGINEISVSRVGSLDYENNHD